eukprot:UC1_evm1s805
MMVQTLGMITLLLFAASSCTAQSGNNSNNNKTAFCNETTASFASDALFATALAEINSNGTAVEKWNNNWAYCNWEACYAGKGGSDGETVDCTCVLDDAADFEAICTNSSGQVCTSEHVVTASLADNGTVMVVFNAISCIAANCEDYTEIERFDQYIGNDEDYSVDYTTASCALIASQAGVVAGIVIGAIAGTAVLGAAGYFLMKQSGRTDYTHIS